MMLLRLLLVAFNVGAVTILVYQLIKLAELPMEKSRRRLAMVIGILLLLLPVAIIVGVIPPTPIYLVIFPVGIGFYLYLIRRL